MNGLHFGRRNIETINIDFSSAENNGASFKIVYSYQKDSPSLITFQTYDTVNFALDDYVGATTGTHVEILIYP